MDRSITKGLKHPHYIDNPFGDIIIRDNFAQRIKQDGIDTPFGHLFFLAFIFLCAHSQRAHQRGDRARVADFWRRRDAMLNRF